MGIYALDYTKHKNINNMKITQNSTATHMQEYH